MCIRHYAVTNYARHLKTNLFTISLLIVECQNLVSLNDAPLINRRSGAPPDPHHLKESHTITIVDRTEQKEDDQVLKVEVSTATTAETRILL